MQRSYNWSINMYVLGAKIKGLWDKKAAAWVEGRKGLIPKIREKINPNDKIAWFHCSSLGEFEQGRPVLERFKKEFPEYKILLTFFSPSGYMMRKDYNQADFVFYLPADTKKNSEEFLDAVNPEIAIFVKYDFWFNFLQNLQERNIPTVYISAIFRSDHHFFKPNGKWFLEILRGVTMFFVQDKYSRRRLNKRNIHNVEVTGDTRFDRVIEVAANPKQYPLVEKFKGDKRVILAGSTWPKDENMMVAMIKKREDEFKYVIVPHEIDQKRINNLMERIELTCIKLSELSHENAEQTDVIIVDTIGDLIHLYQYADLAYIGGGFDKGIHNILEPAAYNIPVIFGPNFTKFKEAKELMDVGGAFAVYAYRNINHKLNDLFFDENNLEAVKSIVSDYMKKNQGATDLIIDELKLILKERNEN